MWKNEWKVCMENGCLRPEKVNIFKSVHSPQTHTMEDVKSKEHPQMKTTSIKGISIGMMHNILICSCM